MSPYIASVGRFVLFLCLTSLVTGCSVIGYGLGSAIAPEEPGEEVIVPEQLLSLKKSTDIIILKKDSTEIRGTLNKVADAQTTISAERYRELYEQWWSERKPDSCVFPSYGSRVQVSVRTLQGADLYAGRFHGFDTGTLRIVPESRERFLPLRLPTVIDMRDSLGQVLVRGDAIKQAVEDGMPLASQLESGLGIILKDTAEPPVGLNDIQAVHLWDGRSARWTLFGVGLALDVAVVVLGASMRGLSPSPGHGFLGGN